VLTFTVSDHVEIGAHERSMGNGMLRYDVTFPGDYLLIIG
jgi:hypothetical protein